MSTPRTWAPSRLPRSGWRRGSASVWGRRASNLVNSCGAAAWQTVFHFHVHVIPRYADDPLRLPWVPAPGDAAEIAGAAQELAAAPRS